MKNWLILMHLYKQVCLIINLKLTSCMIISKKKKSEVTNQQNLTFQIIQHSFVTQVMLPEIIISAISFTLDHWSI
jgi:hypothetical protein